MKKKIFSLPLVLLEMTALLTSAASKPDIAVQSGPVVVMQGNNVSLWCKLEGVAESELPAHWQSPPNFRTRTANCVSFVRKKYWVSCAKSPITWYNMTVTDVQWTDKGKYRCIHTSLMAIVDLQVLVPVTEVTLVSNSTAESLFVRKDAREALTCTTNCAYPAPEISWFENGQPSKDRATITTTVTELGCSGNSHGQKRAISTIIVRGNVETERKVSIISCEAGNIFGEKNISKEIAVIYDADPCDSVRCPPGLVCQATSKNPGVCVCGPPDFCDGHHKQVCGDDGIMYSSLCELNRTACIKGKHIGVDHTNNTCKPEEVTPSSLQTSLGEVVIVAVVLAVIGLTSFFVLVCVRHEMGRKCIEKASKQHSNTSLHDIKETNNDVDSTKRELQSDITEPIEMKHKEKASKQPSNTSLHDIKETTNDVDSTKRELQSDITEPIEMRTWHDTSAREGQVDSARTDSSRNSETPMLRLSTDSNVPKGRQGCGDPVILSVQGMVGRYKPMINRQTDNVSEAFLNAM